MILFKLIYPREVLRHWLNNALNLKYLPLVIFINSCKQLWHIYEQLLLDIRERVNTEVGPIQ